MRNLCFVLLVLICCGRALAQPEIGQYQLSAGIGTFSSTAIGNPGVFMDIKESPSIIVSGKYFVTNHVAIGVSAGMQWVSGDIIGVTSSTSFKETDIILAFEGTFIYIKSHDFEMYGLLGLGVNPYNRSTTENDYPPIPNYQPTTYTTQSASLKGTGQFTPLGFRFGDDIAAFVELGYGYKGIFSGGMAFTLGKSEANKKAKPKQEAIK